MLGLTTHSNPMSFGVALALPTLCFMRTPSTRKASQGSFLGCGWSGIEFARASRLILGPLDLGHMDRLGVGVGVDSE